MMNSDLYSSVLGPQADCHRLRQRRIRRHQPVAGEQGGALFNNLIADSKVQEVVAVDFVPMPQPWGADPRT